MNSRLGTTTLVCSLVIAAGTAYGQRDTQPDHRRNDNPVNRQSAEQLSAGLAFMKGSKLIGTDVANPNNEVIASVQDAIIQRGSGRLEHALLKSGAVMGVGGKTIAVPYSRLRFDEAKNRFELDMTKEQIDRAVSFVPDDWSELKNASWADKLDQWWYGDGDEEHEETNSERAVKEGSKETVQGTVESVERTRIAGRGEQVVVAIRSDDGRTERVILGPSWYVMGHEAAPMRGDKIKAETVRLSDDADGRRVAVSATVDGDSLVLRDSNGHPRWRATAEDNENRDTETNRQKSPHRAGRLILLSKLIGASASTTDKTGGEVQEVIVERSSGQIAMIGFDPNENLLGIADEIKVVPWSVVSVGADQKVRIDAGSAILKSAEKMPDDLTVYTNSGRLEPVYRIFEVPPVRFMPRDRQEARGRTDEGWGKEGYYSKLFRDAPDATVTGKVLSVKAMSLREGMPETRVLVVNTENGEQSVILGPEWYLKQQTLAVNDGSRVVIQGKRARIGDRDYICAHTIDADGRSLTLWDSNTPMWEGR